MMDLTKKALPNTVMVGGRAYSIYTDFRLWMRFEIAVRKLKRGDTIDISYLFKNDMPSYCDLTELFAFSRPESPLPRPISHSNVIALDYEIDADLIYAAFLGQYGIDLMEVEQLHWHKFLALLGGLNESTKLREVIGYRCYEKSADGDKDIYEELRRAWEIEPPMSDEERAELEEFSNVFK
ncbi:MAG: Gp15 family bacteriophage protein [Clostridiales bacterium]|nr:bacteriophage Gp15 family protein [Roseburia sp.]MDD7636416.1 Gp15 family bacteriophage protein [Clostridiales bacterium]